MNHDKESRLQLGLFGNDFAWHNWGSGQMLEGRDCILSGQADGLARQPDRRTRTDLPDRLACKVCRKTIGLNPELRSYIICRLTVLIVFINNFNYEISDKLSRYQGSF